MSSVYWGVVVLIPTIPVWLYPGIVIKILLEFVAPLEISIKLKPPDPNPREFIKFVSPVPFELFQLKYVPWLKFLLANPDCPQPTALRYVALPIFRLENRNPVIIELPLMSNLYYDDGDVDNQLIQKFPHASKVKSL